LFFVYPATKSTPVSMPCLLACAAYTGDRFSTLAIVRQFGETLGPGYAAELVKRIQYN